MALPVTITGISTAVITVGPFKCSSSPFISTGPIGGIQQGVGSAISNERASQSFSVGSSSISVDTVVWVLGKTGAPTDNWYCDLYLEAGGVPTGAVIATSNAVVATGITGTAAAPQSVSFTFATPVTLSNSTIYCAVLRRSGALNASNNLVVIGNSSNPYSGGAAALFNNSAWQTSGTTDYAIAVSSSANEGFYFFGRDGTTATTLQAFKSTAPDTSWSSIATKTGFTTAILNLSGYQVGDVIHMLVMDGTASTSAATKYVSFNMATDTFLATTETVAVAQALTGQAASGWGHSLVVRSNGEVVALYNGLQTKTSGTFRARVYYRRRTAVNTWSTETQVDANGADDAIWPGAVLGAGDIVHFNYSYTNTTNHNQRALSAANALQTQVASGVSNSPGPYTAAAYVDGATTRIVVGGNGQRTMFYDSVAVPTISVNSTALFGFPGRVRADGTIVYCLYRNATDSDLYIKSQDKPTSVSAWSSAISAFVGTVGANYEYLSRSGPIYQRGAAVVIPYIVNDNGTLKYNEYIVRSLSITGTLSEVEDADTASFAGVAVIPDVTGTLSEIEDPDVAVSAGGKVEWLATLATVEAADTAVSTGGKVEWRGQLATTEGADTAAGTGRVEWLATLAAPEAADTAALTGSLAVPVSGPLAVTEAADAAVSTGGKVEWLATLTAGETADTANSTGQVAWLAVLAAPEAADVAASTGNVAWRGPLATVEAADVATVTGFAAAFGPLAVSETGDTASATGSVRWEAVLSVTELADTALITAGSVASGTLVVTEAADTANSIGQVAWSAVLAATEAADVAVGTGFAAAFGPLAVTETGDTTATSGSVRWQAALAVIEPADTALVNGGIYGTGTLVVIEAADTAAMLGGGVTLGGPLAVTEAADTAALVGGIYGTGTLATVEAADTAGSSGQVRWVAVLAASEPADTAGLTGSVRWQATLAVIEAADIAVLTGPGPGTGTLAALEASDTAVFTTSMGLIGILTGLEAADSTSLVGSARWVGVLAADEVPDTAAMSGKLGQIGSFAATDLPDTVAATGRLGLSGTLSAAEAADSADATGEVYSAAVLTAIEQPDSVLFTAAPVVIQELRGHILKNAVIRVRTLASASQRVRVLKYPVTRPREMINMHGHRIRQLDGQRIRDLEKA